VFPVSIWQSQFDSHFKALNKKLACLSRAAFFAHQLLQVGARSTTHSKAFKNIEFNKTGAIFHPTEPWIKGMILITAIVYQNQYTQAQPCMEKRGASLSAAAAIYEFYFNNNEKALCVVTWNIFTFIFTMTRVILQPLYC